MVTYFAPNEVVTPVEENRPDSDSQVEPLPELVVSELETDKPTNVLLIILDDIGVDYFPGYDIGAIIPSMPNIEALITEGILYDQVWSYPMCSPTRASIISGKYGYNTGVLNAGRDSYLDANEISLQQHLATTLGSGISSAVIGKWHIAGNRSPDFNHPAELGVPYYSGIFSNVPENYYQWNKVTNGVQSKSENYITTELTDDAIGWIDDQKSPWFMWLAYTAPHDPLHAPPSGTHSQGTLSGTDADINANPEKYFMAMVENVDYEIGRVLDSLTPKERVETTVIILGDNGTGKRVIQVPYDRTQSKGTVYEGGIRVPMVIAGAGVTRHNEKEGALVHTSDLYPTIAALLGAPVTKTIDGIDFSNTFTDINGSERTNMVTEIKTDQGVDRAVRDDTYKLIRFGTGEMEFYNLDTDPFEQTDLLTGLLDVEASEHYQQLTTYLNQINSAF